MLIAQITDCHVVVPGELVADRVDPAPALEQAVEMLNRHGVDLVIGTGDLVNDGLSDQYDRLEGLLAALEAPFVPVPGNHDDRTQLRRRWSSLPDGEPATPIDHVIDDHPVRIVLLDTTIPGRHDGRCTDAQAGWLDRTLAEAPDRPTLVFQHHPPFVTGITWMDETCGFDGGQREEDVIARHPQVLGVHCGHLHRSIHRRFGGTIASCWPSSTVQLDLMLAAGPPVYCDDPPAVVIHQFDGSAAVNSHLAVTTTRDRWTPSWDDT